MINWLDYPKNTPPLDKVLVLTVLTSNGGCQLDFGIYKKNREDEEPTLNAVYLTGVVTYFCELPELPLIHLTSSTTLH
jgi:hypothetical protein